MTTDENDIVYRLRKRAEIRRQIPSRKSVQEGTEDRLAKLLEDAAEEIGELRKIVREEFENKIWDEIMKIYTTPQKIP